MSDKLYDILNECYKFESLLHILYNYCYSNLENDKEICHIYFFLENLCKIQSEITLNIDTFITETNQKIQLK